MVTVENYVLKPTKYRPRNKDWMTDEILDLIEQRRLWKNKKEGGYRDVYRNKIYNLKRAKEVCVEKYSIKWQSRKRNIMSSIYKKIPTGREKQFHISLRTQ